MKYAETKEKLEDLINKSGGTIPRADLERFGLTEYESKYFKKLIRLGKGSFGEVWRTLEQRGEEWQQIAVKFIQVKGTSQEKLLENASSFLIEKIVLEKLSYHNCANITKPKGAFFIWIQELHQLILASECGDFNLNELIKERRKNRESAYTSEEALQFLAHMATAFEKLQKSSIYHSDVKPQNIVFSMKEKVYKLIDFGVSKIIENANIDEEQNTTVDIEEYAYEGSAFTFSPEKKLMWESRTKETGEKEEVYTSTIFNPYKCDMYSLGVCLKMMLRGNTDISEFMIRVIQGLTHQNWRERLDARQLLLLLSENNIVVSPEAALLHEYPFLVQLDEERQQTEGYEQLYQRFDNAFMNKEMLDVALRQLEKESLKENPILFKIHQRIGKN